MRIITLNNTTRALIWRAVGYIMMNDGKYIPGPWRVGGMSLNELGLHLLSICDTDGLMVAMIPAGPWGDLSETKKANADLIAAAPELLLMLRCVRAWIEAGYPGGEETMLTEIDDIIHKAAGIE